MLMVSCCLNVPPDPQEAFVFHLPRTADAETVLEGASASHTSKGSFS